MLKDLKFKNGAIFLKFKEESLESAIGSYCRTEDDFLQGHSSLEKAIHDGRDEGGEGFEVWEAKQGKLKMVYSSSGSTEVISFKVTTEASLDFEVSREEVLEVVNRLSDHPIEPQMLAVSVAFIWGRVAAFPEEYDNHDLLILKQAFRTLHKTGTL